MRVFITGATGFIGSAIVQELQQAGHQVVGLARNDKAAATLKSWGAGVFRGDLEDPDSLRLGASSADGVIHTGFNHDFSTFAANCEADRRAIAALGSALLGSSRLLIVTSGTALLPPDGLRTEDSAPRSGAAHPRVASEEAADAIMARGGRVAVMRLPPAVHGDGDHGFVPLLIDVARTTCRSAYVGDGSNRWPAVHRLDAARLYRLALEADVAGGRYHGVAEEGVAFREIATVIGHRLDVPVVSRAPETAAEHFGWFAHFAALNNPTSSQWTRERLAWQPTQAGLIADLDRQRYFER